MDENNADSEGEVGGGLLSSPDKIISDCNLISRYPICAKLRKQMISVLARIAGSSKQRPRERIAAVKALTAIDRLNMIDEQGGNGGVVVQIVNQNNQQVSNQPMQLVELSDADLNRIAATGSPRAIEAEGGQNKPS